jgi:hypothetical protein
MAHNPDDKPKPKVANASKATPANPKDDAQVERFKALAIAEGLDTPEAKKAFERSLFSIAKGGSKGRSLKR